MKPIEPRPPRTKLIEETLKGMTLYEKVDYFINNQNELNQYYKFCNGLLEEDFYSYAMASYKMNKKFNTELEFALDQRSRLLRSINNIKEKYPQEINFIPIHELNIQYFNLKLKEMHEQIMENVDTNNYNALTKFQLNELIETLEPTISSKNSTRIIWNGTKGELIYLFAALKKRVSRNSQFYIENSNEEIAVFLKENFEIFADTKLSTLQTELKKGKKPVKSTLDLDKLL